LEQNYWSLWTRNTYLRPGEQSCRKGTIYTSFWIHPNFPWRWSVRPCSSGTSIKKKAKLPFILNPSWRAKGFRKHHQEKKLKFIQLAREREARGQGKAGQKPSPGQMMKLGQETRESQVVFASSVLWTKKIHRTELNWTMVRSIFRLWLPKFGVIPVAGCLISKIIQNHSKIIQNRSKTS